MEAVVAITINSGTTSTTAATIATSALTTYGCCALRIGVPAAFFFAVARLSDSYKRVVVVVVVVGSSCDSYSNSSGSGISGSRSRGRYSSNDRRSCSDYSLASGIGG